LEGLRKAENGWERPGRAGKDWEGLGRARNEQEV